MRELIAQAEALERLHASKQKRPSIGGQQLGLEEYVIRANGNTLECLMEAAEYLRAQAEQPAEQGEPVAWAQLGMKNGRSYLRMAYDREPYPPPADVVRNLNLKPLFERPDPRIAALEGLLRECAALSAVELDNGLRKRIEAALGGSK